MGEQEALERANHISNLLSFIDVITVVQEKQNNNLSNNDSNSRVCLKRQAPIQDFLVGRKRAKNMDSSTPAWRESKAASVMEEISPHQYCGVQRHKECLRKRGGRVQHWRELGQRGGREQQCIGLYVCY